MELEQLGHRSPRGSRLVDNEYVNPRPGKNISAGHTLAEFIGVRRLPLNRVLKELESERIIALAYRRISTCDRKQLERRAEDREAPTAA